MANKPELSAALKNMISGLSDTLGYVESISKGMPDTMTKEQAEELAKQMQDAGVDKMIAEAKEKLTGLKGAFNDIQ